MGDEKPKRFFVTIIAPDRERLQAVFGRGLYLFAGRSDDSGHRVDGLITLEEVGMLVEAGYRLLVCDTDRPRREHRIIGAEEWMKDTLADLERQRKKS